MAKWRSLTLSLALVVVAFTSATAEVRFVHAGAGALRDDAAEELTYLRRHRCRAGALDAARRALFDRATEHARRALADASVADLLKAKRDWGHEGADEGISLGAQLLGQLADKDVEVAVIAYGRDAGHPCNTSLMDPGIHAYSRPGLPFVVIRDDYVDTLLGAEDGVRRLAGTIAHEMTHVLGHVHPNALTDLGSSDYLNSVPTFVGCAARHYPSIESIQRSCSHSGEAATVAQKPRPGSVASVPRSASVPDRGTRTGRLSASGREDPGEPFGGREATLEFEARVPVRRE